MAKQGKVTYENMKRIVEILENKGYDTVVLVQLNRTIAEVTGIGHRYTIKTMINSMEDLGLIHYVGNQSWKLGEKVKE